MRGLLFCCCIAAITLYACGQRNTSTNKVTEQNQNKDLQEDSSYTLVRIDTSFSGIKIYYPATSSISLYVGEEPRTEGNYICFCCAASYTDKTIYQHPNNPEHSDVAGDHIVGGTLFHGYDCPNNTGGFVWYPFPEASWKIVNQEEYKALISNAPLPFTAFQQELLIHHGEIIPFVRPDRPTRYRALCNLNNELCIIDGTRNHLLASFVDILKNAGVSDALYLDMGNWSYSWYRDTPEDLDGTPSEVTIIYNKPSRYFGTNWITFWYAN